MASGLFRRVIMESGNILGTLTFHSQGEKEAQKAIEKSFCNGIGISDNESADRLAKIRELDARSLQRDGNQEHDTGYEGYLSLLTFDGKTLNTRGNILNNINNVDLLFGYDINDFNNRLGHINTQEEYDAILGNLLGAEGATA
jgi:carboxylesterase type B